MAYSKSARITRNVVKTIRNGTYRMPANTIEIKDPDTPGFRLKINKSGPPSYYYRYEGGAIFLGSGDDQTPEAARELCVSLRAKRDEHKRTFARTIPTERLKAYASELRFGIVPADQEHWTVAELFDEFLPTKQDVASYSSYKTWRHSPEFAVIAEYTVPQLTPELLQREVKEATVKRVTAAPGPHKGEAAANRHLSYLGEAIAWGVENHRGKTGLREEDISPTRRVRRYKEEEGSRTANFFDEAAMRHLLKALTTFDAHQWAMPVLALLFLVASGQRKGSVLRTSVAAIRQADDRMNGRTTVFWPKTITKSRRGFALPCSPVMKRIIALAMRRRREGSAYLFPAVYIRKPSLHADAPMAFGTVNNLVRTKTARDSDLRKLIRDNHIHDLRGTFATHLVRHGVPELYLSLVFDHIAERDESTVARFYRGYGYTNEKISALDAMSDLLIEWGINDTLDAVERRIEFELEREARNARRARRPSRVAKKAS